MQFDEKPISRSPEVRRPAPGFLLFDLGNVFLAADDKITHRYLQERCGVSPERAATYFTGSEYRDFSRGLIDEHTFSDALRVRLNSPSLTDQQLRDAHDSHIYGLIPGMSELLVKLTQQHGEAFIIFVTDTNAWQTARQQQLIDLSRYKVITSDEVHMLKSDPETVDEGGHRISFFLSVLDQLQVEPETTLLIDDSPEKIEMAKRYRMQTLQFVSGSPLEENLRDKKII